MKAIILICAIGLTLIWCPAVRGQDGELEESVVPKSKPVGGSSDGKPTGKPARIVIRREAVYDHRPGKTGIVGWINVYSDGTRGEYVGGAGESEKPGKPQPSAGKKGAPRAMPADIRAKLRQFEDKAERIVEMVESEQQKIKAVEDKQKSLSSTMQGFERRISELSSQSNRLDSQIPRSTSQKRSLPPVFQCPNGKSLAECTHLAEKAAYERERKYTLEMNAAIDRQRQTVDRMRLQKDTVDRQRKDVEAKLASCKRDYEALRRQKHEAQQRKAEWLGQLKSVKRLLVPLAKQPAR